MHFVLNNDSLQGRLSPACPRKNPDVEVRYIVIYFDVIDRSELIHLEYSTTSTNEELKEFDLTISDTDTSAKASFQKRQFTVSLFILR